VRVYLGVPVLFGEDPQHEGARGIYGGSRVDDGEKG
jgi:hypothetical protein